MKDGLAALAALEGATLVGAAPDAAALLAVVVGQDVAEGDDGCSESFGVAKDHVISTVDPQARHGHKSRNCRFDGQDPRLHRRPLRAGGRGCGHPRRQARPE